MGLWHRIEAAISTKLAIPFQITSKQAVGGGSINAAVKITDGQRSFFVKFNSADLRDMFEAEAEGLMELQGSVIRVPNVVLFGTAEGYAYIVLENLALQSHGSHQQLGQNLASLHRRTQARFGWKRDNTIGSTPQANHEHDHWCDFWAHQRLGFQLRLAAKNGHNGALERKGEYCLQRLNAWLSGYQPEASLLHGDLWSGNYAFDEHGDPVIFDPAIYYGDRETDLAMTELFGGFPREFYSAYEDAWPLDHGYAWRKILYNLYHILNHLNLFGGGYHSQAIGMMDRLIAECG